MRYLSRFIVAILLVLVAVLKACAQSIRSPDQKITVTVNTGPQLSYRVSYNQQEVTAGNRLVMTLTNGNVLGINSRLLKKSQRSINQVLKPVYGMAATYPDQYNELTLDFRENFSVIFRVYNSGVAYRFVTRLPGRIRVKSELAEFTCKEPTKAWMQSGIGHNFYEDKIEHNDLTTLTGGRVACLPLLLDSPFKAAVLETDVLDYPTMLLETNGRGA